MGLFQSHYNPIQIRQAIAVIAPIVLIATMWTAFKGLNSLFGYPVGYLLAFLIYWVGWCLIFPAILLGGIDKVVALFHPIRPFGSLDWQSHALLWWPIFFPMFFMLIPRVAKANPAILIASILLGVIIGITEEIFWRGMYLTLFHGNLWLGILYPSLMFGLWHICPQSVLENKLPGGVFSFVAYAAILGLSYAFAAQRTGSIFWPAISHIIHDTFGLGGFAYRGWLEKK